MATAPKVVVLGAGFAGLESAFYLRHKLENKVDITLVSDRDYFTFKPNSIYVPFGEEADKFRTPLAGPTQRKHIEFIQSTVRDIDATNSKVFLEDSEITFDYLVIATGAAMRLEEVPGLRENSMIMWTPDDLMGLRFGYQRMLERARFGDSQKLLFLIPPHNRWAAPLYEMALMTDTWLREQSIRTMVGVTFATSESSYVQAFGPRMDSVVSAEFEDRNIAGCKGFDISHIEPGVATFGNGETHDFDLLVTFPPYVSARAYSDLPADDRGFLHVDPDSRRVKGYDRIFAVGDTADFPVKQAVSALLQADAAADHIAAAIENRKPEIVFEPMSLFVMEEFNKATYAEVPLTASGEVVTHDEEHYKVGVSPLWRIGKKLMGQYVPWRFGQGEPFHAGLAWNALEIGRKLMSKTIAR